MKKDALASAVEGHLTNLDDRLVGAHIAESRITPKEAFWKLFSGHKFDSVTVDGIADCVGLLDAKVPGRNNYAPAYKVEINVTSIKDMDGSPRKNFYLRTCYHNRVGMATPKDVIGT